MGVRRKIALAVGAVFATFVVTAISFARPGDVDHKFGGNNFGLGIVEAGRWTNGLDDFSGMAMGPNGEIALVGDTNSPDDYAIARLGPNGKLDASFGDANHVAVGDISGDDDVSGAAIQPNGRIVVVAESQLAGNDVFGVARVLRDGTPDGGFNGTGAVTTPIGASAGARAVQIQKDGKIVVVGSAGADPGAQQFAIVRYLAGGTPDPSFGGGDGIVTTNFGGTSSSALGLTIQKDGKLVVVGGAADGSNQRLAVARYRPNGKLDSSFGKAGRVKVGSVEGLEVGFDAVVQPSGRIVVVGVKAGGGTESAVVVGLTPRGKLDRHFGPRRNGEFTTRARLGLAFGTSIALQRRNSKIVISGIASDIPSLAGASFLARLTSNGRLDQGFADHGVRLFLTGASGLNLGVLGIQPNGRIVGAGEVEDDVGDIQVLLVRRFLGDPRHRPGHHAGRTHSRRGLEVR